MPNSVCVNHLRAAQTNVKVWQLTRKMTKTTRFKTIIPIHIYVLRNAYKQLTNGNVTQKRKQFSIIRTLIIFGWLSMGERTVTYIWIPIHMSCDCLVYVTFEYNVWPAVTAVCLFKKRANQPQPQSLHEVFRRNIWAIALAWILLLLSLFDGL